MHSEFNIYQRKKRKMKYKKCGLLLHGFFFSQMFKTDPKMYMEMQET